MHNYVFPCVGVGVFVWIVIVCSVIMFMVNTILKVLFVEMYVNVFIKLFVQR